MIDLSPMKGIRVDPGAADRARRGRRDLGRVRPRDAGLRTGHHRRRRPDDRHRRAHPRRRARLADAQATAWPATTCSPPTSSPPTASFLHRERRRAPGPLLGRCAAAAATSASSPRSSTSSTRSGRSLLAGLVFHPLDAGEGCLPVLPRLHAPPRRTSCTAYSPSLLTSPGRTPGRRVRRLLRRPARDGRGGAARRCSAFGTPLDGHDRADAVLRRPAAVRRRFTRRSAQLLEVELHRRAQRRSDRRASSSFAEVALAASPLVVIEQFGGAVARVPDDETAFSAPRRRLQPGHRRHLDRPGGQRAATSHWAREFYDARCSPTPPARST